MKYSNLLFVVVLVLSALAMVSTPTSAFEWTNIITLEEDGMSWTYEEKYAGEDAELFRSFVDEKIGNDDGYVTAWELMKVDHRTRTRLQNSLDKQIDVVFDNTAKNVSVSSVDATISREGLGDIGKSEDITNMYFVNYKFEQDFFETGTSVSFDGEANTDIIITMPEGIEVIATEGIESRFIETIENRTIISGHIGTVEYITVDFNKI